MAKLTLNPLYFIKRAARFRTSALKTSVSNMEIHIMWYCQLVNKLHALADEQRAWPMKRYMKNQFDFLGIPTPLRRKTCAEFFLKAVAEHKQPDLAFCDLCYASNYRELQYVAVNYLQALQPTLRPGHVPRIKQYIINKSWLINRGGTPLTGWIG